MWQLKAQTGASCLTAKSLTLTPTQSTGWQTTALDTIWYEFTATHQNQIYEVSTDVHFVKHIKYALASTGCSLSNITDGGMRVNDSTFMLSFSNLTIGQSYKMLLISKNFSSCLFCSTSGFSNYNITFVSAPLSTISSCSSINTCLTSPPCDLICNGNFETISSPPSNPSDFSFLCNWDNLLGTCDMYNNGGNPNYEVPCNYNGNEADFIAGNHGYVGFIGYAAFGINSWIENTGTTLKTPMIAGRSYQISFKLSLADDSKYYTDNIGVEVSGGIVSFPLPTYINMSGLSKNGWTTYSTIYNSIGGEDYLTLGAFNTGGMPAIPVTHLYTGVNPSSSCFGFTHPDPTGGDAYYYLDEVSILEVGTLSVTPYQQTICQGGSANINIISPIVGEIYTWSPASSIVSGQGTPNVVVNPTSNTVYTVTTSAGGCLNTANAYVYVLDTPPTISLTASPNPICQNQAITFTATTLSGFPYTYPSYTWDAPIGVSTASIVSITPTGSGLFTYNVTGSDPFANCFTSASVIVQVDKTPSFSITPSTVCFGELITANINDVTTILGLQPYTIDWSFGIQNYYAGSTQSFLYPAPGTYTVSFTGINGACNIAITQTVQILALKPKFDIGSINCQNLSVCFNNTSSCIIPASQWLWTVTGTGGFTQTSTALNLCQIFPAVGIYTVCLQQDNGAGLSPANCQTIAITAPQTVVITNTLLSLCNLPASGLLTLDPNILLGSTGTANWNAYNQTTGLALVLPYTTGINGIITYNLTGFSTYTAPIVFCVNASINGCDANQCITIYPCCTTNTATTIKYTNTTFTGNTILNSFTSGFKYTFSGIITVSPTATLTLHSADVIFDPNTKIIVKGKIRIIDSYLHGCGAMWDGIYLYNGSQFNTGHNGSTIEDAKRAIVDTLGASVIKINSTWFNKNYESIILKSTNTTSNLTIGTNLFTCDDIPVAYQVAMPDVWNVIQTETTISTLPATFLLPPYSSQKSFSGITLFQTKTPANPSQFVQIDKYNLFDKLRFGIVATRSRLVVQKNTFQNITTFKGASAGIYIYGQTTISVLNYEAKIGGTIPQANKFENCYYGVLNQYATILTVRNNKFNNNNTAITVAKNNRNKLVTIDRNKINETKIGISCFDNVIINAQITENTLLNTSPVGAYNSNTGISTSEVIYSTLAKYNVYNNSITGYYNGVYATNTFDEYVRDNEIHLIPDNTPFHFQFGIRYENTNNIKVWTNNIDKPSPDNSAWWQYGIFGNTNVTSQVHCNGINNMYASLKFQGPSFTASTGNGIAANVMSGAQIGIWLDASAEIGDQFINLGSGNKASDNQWTYTSSPTNPQTYASSSSNIVGGIGSKLYTLGIPSSPYYLNITNATYVGGSIPLIGAYISSYGISCNTGIPTPAIMQNANNVATNTMSFVTNVSNLNAISKRQLLHNIKLQNINITANPTLTNFVNSTFTNSIGQFYKVDSIINSSVVTGSMSLLSNATLLNNAITSSSAIESNKKMLHATYINMFSSEPDSTTLANLRTLAVKCPNDDGDAVFQARGILMYYDSKTYVSTCELQATAPIFGASQRLSNKMTQTDENKTLNIYPNPTNKDITIEYTKGEDNEPAELLVYNQIGELILVKTLTDNKTEVNLSILSSGIYLYTIKQQGLILKTNKLVITK